MKKQLDQRGAVSLISVVIFIIIITIVILAYLASALSQQRSAVNYDMSTRAYYSAESGIQDALRAFKADPGLNRPDCKPFLGGDSQGRLGDTSLKPSGQPYDYGLSYTCQIIDRTPKNISGTTSPFPNQSTAMFRLNPVSLPSSGNYVLRIRWSLKPTNTTPVSNLPAARENSQQTLPQITDWKNANGEFNSMLRVSLINHPKTAISRDAIGQSVAFLNPAKQNSSLAFTKGSANSGDTLISNADCQSTSGYFCEKTINLNGYDFGSDILYLRVGSIYRSTDFEVTLSRGGIDVELADTQATIDVTGRAKDVYRRVRQAFPIAGGYFNDTTPDAAVISAEGICKLFSVTDKPEEFNSKCNPLTD
ncbi:MAG: hypothetical protein U0520_01140 [Candidatus Saccharimonadales bacterium]